MVVQGVYENWLTLLTFYYYAIFYIITVAFHLSAALGIIKGEHKSFFEYVFIVYIDSLWNNNA